MANIVIEKGRFVFRAAAEKPLKLSSEVGKKLGSENVTFFRGGYAVSFSFGAQLLEIFPRESNEWTPEALSLAEGQVLKARRQADAKRMVEEALREPYRFLKPSSIIGILDNHQVEAVAAMTVPGLSGFCLFDEQGTGKTLMTIAAFDALYSEGEINTMIIFAPKTMLQEWAAEFDRFLPGKYEISLVTGARGARRKALEQNASIFLLNYQGATTELTKLITMVRHPHRRVLLVVDESFFVKNEEALRSAAIRELRRHCEKAFLLCGTPAPNTAKDVVNQFDIADDGVTFSNFKMPFDEEAARVAIKQRIEQSGIYLRRLKGDVFSDIPEKVIEKIFVNLQPVQHHKYKEVLGDLILKVRKTNDVEFRQKLSSFLAQRSVLLQMCLNPKKFDQNYVEIPCKYLAIDRLLKELIEEKSLQIFFGGA
jgi:SNF2 family DNA or RNA helicase